MEVYVVIKSNGEQGKHRCDSVVKIFDSMEKAREYVERNMLEPWDYGDSWCYYDTPYNEVGILRYKVY